MTSVATRSGSRRLWMRRAAPAVLSGWVAARVLVVVSFVLAHLLAPHTRLPDGRLHLREGLLTWDGGIYRLISQQGYARSPRDVVRFFPLYPLLGRWLGWVLGGAPGIALVLLGNGGALVAAFVMWRIVDERFGDRRMADGSTLLLSLSPAAMCLVFAYAEGLFLVCVLVSIRALTRRRPLAAVPWLIAASLLRPTGVVLIVPVAVAWWIQRRSLRSSGESSRDLWTWVIAGLGPVAGLATYLGWLELALHRGSQPLSIQSRLRAGFHEPISRLVRAAVHVFTGEFRDVYNLAFAIALIALVVVAIRRRLPPEWTAYLVVGLVIAASANNIDSLGRYGIVLAPAWVVALAMITTGRRDRVIVLTVSALGFVWFTTAALLGLVVP